MVRRLALCLLLVLLCAVASAQAEIQFETASLLPISKGDSGAIVKRVQQRLIDWSFAYGLSDGVFGSQTESAVKWAQRYLNKNGYSFAVDGSVSEELYAALMKNKLPESETALRVGSKNDDVTRLQRRLMLLGYLDTITGSFSKLTKEAVTAFQERNGLTVDGVAGQETRELLYSDQAIVAEKPLHDKLVYVSTVDQRVYVYAWGENGYEGPIRTFVCSTGMEGHATITGIFKTQAHCGDWYWFNEYAVWARYAIRIRGPYLFHSTLYSRKSESAPQQSSIRALGSPASHGCVRMDVDDIRWLYDNTDEHFVAIIY